MFFPTKDLILVQDLMARQRQEQAMKMAVRVRVVHGGG